MTLFLPAFLPFFSWHFIQIIDWSLLSLSQVLIKQIREYAFLSVQEIFRDTEEQLVRSDCGTTDRKEDLPLRAIPGEINKMHDLQGTVTSFVGTLNTLTTHKYS